MVRFSEFDTPRDHHLSRQPLLHAIPNSVGFLVQYLNHRRETYIYIFITGASSGIGRATALHLAASSPYTVFACMRDITAFANPPPRIMPVVIDVTVRSTIEESAAVVSERIPPDDEPAPVGLCDWITRRIYGFNERPRR